MRQKTTSVLSISHQTKLLIALFATCIFFAILIIINHNRMSTQGTIGEQTHTYVLLSEAAPVFGLVVDQKLTVVEVERGGAAEQAGIQPGDILVAINDQSINSFTAIQQTTINQNAEARQSSTTITINRGGQALRKAITLKPPQTSSNQPTPTPVPETQFYF